MVRECWDPNLPKKYMNCGLINHYASTCRQSPKSNILVEIKDRHKVNKQVELNRSENKMTEEYGSIAITFGIKKIDGTFREIVAMFDTGACSTLIEQEFLDGKDIEVKHMRAQTVPIFSASETLINNQGEIEVTIKVGHRSCEQKMIVTQGVKLPIPMILGRDYMQRHDIDLKLRFIEERSYVELRIGGNAVSLEPRVDNNVTIMTWDPKVLNNTNVNTVEVERESEWMSSNE